MAVGKEIGAFDLTSTSVSLTPGKGHSVTAHVNYEGKVTGEIAGRVLTTMTIESADGKDGTYKICTRFFMHGGEVLDSKSEGETTSLGGLKWRVAGVGTQSSGRSTAIQGEVDLENHTYVGKLFERN